MANVLDYLLPQSFMSDVQTVFKPKNSTGYGINKLQSSLFTPGFKDANNYSVYSNLLDQGYQPAMTKPLKLSGLRKLDAGSYTGELESKRATLAQGLQSNLTQASQIGSGFAGYGQRNIASNLAQNQYSQGIEGVYQGINQQRATALQGLYSSLDDMRGLISKNNG